MMKLEFGSGIRLVVVFVLVLVRWVLGADDGVVVLAM